MTSFRRSRILHHYQFKDGISRQATSMENAKRLESDEPELKPREDILVYQRTIDRQMRNEMGEKIDGAAQ